MMRFIGWLFGALLLIAAGWIGGPVAMASYNVATANAPHAARYAVAKRLVDTVTPPVKPSDPGHSSSPRDDSPIRACGYDPVALLGDEKGAFLRSADWGSEALRNRASIDFNAVAPDLRAQHFAQHYSVPELATLTECLDSPLAFFCRRIVDPMVVAADATLKKEIAENQSFLREQDQAILCTFLDGAAARRGIAKTPPAPTPAS